MVYKNDLYVGTANPFQGCEVLKTNKASFVDMLYHCQNLDYDNVFSKLFEDIDIMYDNIIIELKKIGMLEILK